MLALVKRRNPLNNLFALICFAIAVYAGGYGFELGARSVGGIRFWLKFEYFGLAFIPYIWFLFLYRFRFGRGPTFIVSLTLLIIPILTCFFVATDEYLHFYYRDVVAVPYGGGLIASLDKGAWYWVNLVYSNGIVLYSLLVSLGEWRRARFVSSSSALWMLLASVSVFAAEFAYQIGLAPHNLDLAPVGFLGGGICQAIAILKYNFLKPDELLKDVIFSGIQEGIIVLNSDGLLSDYNEAAKKIFPWLGRDEIGKPVRGRERAEFLAVAPGKAQHFRTGSGSARKSYSVKATAMRDREKTLGTVFLIRDITSLRRIMRRLYLLANYDSLTKVFTRRRFFDEAEREYEKSRRYKSELSLLLLDIDHFKSVNDDFGHLAGDFVLREVSKAMKGRIRSSDFVGRFGGEEFTILLPETGWEGARRLADSIRDGIASLDLQWGSKRIPVTVSIGVASLSSEALAVSFDHMLSQADEALYRAKAAGRNKVG